MARPYNAEARSSVIEAAEWLFVTRGFETTSYQQIAKASGISRSLTQHYFPRKELMAIGFFEDLNEAMCRALDERGILDGDRFTRQSRLAQLSYTYLTRASRASDFTVDIFGSRHLTSQVIGIVYKDIVAATQDKISVPIDEAIETIRFATGGFFESYYNDLVDSKEIDVPRKLRRAMTTILEIYPEGPEGCAARYDDSIIDPPTMQALIDDVAARFPSEEPPETLDPEEVRRYRESLRAR